MRPQTNHSLTTRPNLGVWGGISVLVGLSACPINPRRMERTPPCIPECHKLNNCDLLDEQLAAAKAPLLRCVGAQAERGYLDRAHKCYRALRLIESARWWLRTAINQQQPLPAVYRIPVETVRLEFLCRIERLAHARTPALIQQRYLELIKAFP